MSLLITASNNAHTEQNPSSKQEVCDPGTIPRCGDSNWQLNTCSDSFKIAFYTEQEGRNLCEY